MGPLDVAQRYFDAWNRRDSAGVTAIFTDGGTYTDPTTSGPLSGPAIAAYVEQLLAAFPNLSFDIGRRAVTGDGVVAAEWMMRGKNSGPFSGAPPTGRSVELPGADFIAVSDERIRSVQGYFDQRTLVDQLGFRVSVVPAQAGLVAFGTSAYVQPGNRARPGAFSLTSIQVRSDKEAEQVRDYAQRITGEIARMPGFISFLGTLVGHRLMTATAWTDAKKPEHVLGVPAHREAAERFLGPNFAAGGMTSVWVPYRINTMWVRCDECGRMANGGQPKAQCECGQPLPEHPPYW
jgi:steroid delta-isomerase-like uncharacterized protein